MIPCHRLSFAMADVLKWSCHSIFEGQQRISFVGSRRVKMAVWPQKRRRNQRSTWETLTAGLTGKRGAWCLARVLTGPLAGVVAGDELLERLAQPQSRAGGDRSWHDCKVSAYYICLYNIHIYYIRVYNIYIHILYMRILYIHTYIIYAYITYTYIYYICVYYIYIYYICIYYIYIYYISRLINSAC
jgi:hypothetical protein